MAAFSDPGIQGILLAPQYLQMVQLCPSKAGFELAAGHNDRFDLRLAQTRFVVIGLEECTRAAARHLSSCRIEGAQMRLEAKRKSALMGGTMQILEISEPITIAKGRQAAIR